MSQPRRRNVAHLLFEANLGPAHPKRMWPFKALGQWSGLMTLSRASYLDDAVLFGRWMTISIRHLAHAWE